MRGRTQVEERISFTYYDKRRPPSVSALVPPYAPIHGRALRVVGGGGHQFSNIFVY